MKNQLDRGDLWQGDHERDLGTHGRGRYATLCAALPAQRIITAHSVEKLRRIDAAAERKPEGDRKRTA